MGGRGAKSGAVVITVGTDGIPNSDGKRYPLAKLGEEVANSVLNRLASIQRDFPDIPTLKEVDTGYLGTNIFGTSNPFTGEITLGLSRGIKYGTPEMQSEYERCVRIGFHPAGTTWEHVFDHEVGHKIVDAVHQRRTGKTGVAGLVGRYNTADNIVSQAYRRLNTSKSLYEARADISKYALKNSHETIAEAFADYRANGRRAKPLSIAIYNVLKEEIGR